jgi:hypothetical protein
MLFEEPPSPQSGDSKASENYAILPLSTSGTSSVIRKVLLALAVVYVIASAYFIFDTRGEVTKLRSDLRADVEKQEKLKSHLDSTDRAIKASTEALAQKVGMTAQDLKASMVARTSELERQQKAAEKRLAEQESQVTGVSGEVAGVKTDLGSAKTELAATQSDLASTKARLERTIGDLGVQSGLIAHDRADLDELKRRGERNYYEFTLEKGARPTPVSTVSLQLKKTDPKKNKFTLNVIADDKTIEKKDRTVAEPMQFITGRDKSLYEVVVMTVEKNKITGYLATPKTAPTPIPTS